MFLGWDIIRISLFLGWDIIGISLFLGWDIIGISLFLGWDIIRICLPSFLGSITRFDPHVGSLLLGAFILDNLILSTTFPSLLACIWTLQKFVQQYDHI